MEKFKFKKTVLTSEGNTLIVNVSFNNYFSISGSLHEVGDCFDDENLLEIGSIHETILKTLPELRLFVDLHMADQSGVTMNSISNGFYHMNSGFVDKTLDHLEQFCKHYRVTEEEYNELKKVNDFNYYGITLYKLGVLDKWKLQADQAFEILKTLNK